MTGHRDIERGEAHDESWRIFSEWTRSGQKGKCPLEPTRFDKRREMKESLSELQERMTASGELQHRMKRLGLRPDQVFNLTPEANSR